VTDRSAGAAGARHGGVDVWGSNSQISNNLVLLATAYDLTANESFRRGVRRPSS
jgi:endoglucanase